MEENDVTLNGSADRQPHRAALEAEHGRLVALRRAVGGDGLDEIGTVGQESTAPDPSPADPGSGLDERERDQSFLDQLDRQLRDVDDALRRLDRGEYGHCEVCGEPIGEARLEARPATRFCLVHQAMAERELGHAAVSGGEAKPASPI